MMGVKLVVDGDVGAAGLAVEAGETIRTEGATGGRGQQLTACRLVL
jgi:hypothetical protein